MRRTTFVVVFLMAGCAASPEPPAAPAASTASTASSIAAPAGQIAQVAPPAGNPVEGLRVATRVGCTGCHGKDGAGAELWENPGKYRLASPNITEKRELYDDAALAAFLRHGKTHDGHQPFGMPFVMFAHLSDREVRDITAWLRALPAATNPKRPVSWFADDVGKQIAAGTFDEQVQWSAAANTVAPAEPPTEPMALGQHLAMTTCSECHGPDLNGYKGDNAPPLIVAKSYSAQNFMRLMRTGITASGKTSTSGLMSEVGSGRCPAMTDDEVHALKAYLDAR